MAFTLTSARSGTLYLRDVIEKNALDCACRHEPFFDWGNPTMFGPAIYDAYAGRLDRVRARLHKKHEYISRLGVSVYVESSHAFLKSAYVAALDVFPDMRLIHLVRDPLYVAKSEAAREARRRHAPFHYYNGNDGERHFCWSLTTREEIYQNVNRARMTLFQKYLLQWIEIENRAMEFIADHNLAERCFTLHSPHDLNDVATIGRLLEFLGLHRKTPIIFTGGRRNASFGYSAVVEEADKRIFQEILSSVPERYLEIFRHKPYTDFDWIRRFHNAKPEPQTS